jgi:hypothetical protein
MEDKIIGYVKVFDEVYDSEQEDYILDTVYLEVYEDEYDLYKDDEDFTLLEEI